MPTSNDDLSGIKVAVIVADGFEQAELDGPVAALKGAGATVEILAQDEAHLKHIIGMHHFEKGPGTKADKLLSDASMNDYHGLLVPGGLANPDVMRQSDAHLTFVRAFMRANKPVAMICHGLWMLADAEMAQGRKVTSWPAIRRDLERAGATWTDEEVVRDGNLVSSRKPDDIPAFSKAFIDCLAAVKRPV